MSQPTLFLDRSFAELEAAGKAQETRIAEGANQEEAFGSTVAAVELYMDAGAAAKDRVDKLRTRARTTALLSLATRLKYDNTFNLDADVYARARLRNTVEQIAWLAEHKASEPPKSTRAQHSEELKVVVNSMNLNGFRFPLWRNDEVELNEPTPHNRVYMDRPDLPLSDQQKKLFAGWKRIPELYPESENSGSQTGSSRAATTDLIQDVTTDCSVVASLCATAAYAERGFPELIVSTVTRRPPSSFKPEALESNSSGHAVVKLFFNGAYRRVIIDDRLPASVNSRSLFVIDRNAPASLWAALVEKAYLKVRGGYDFPGSNSATDLWILTGWIPEQIRLRDDTTSETLWDRIYTSFHRGELLITLGTGIMSDREEKDVGLVSQHSYAVIDMISDPDHGRVVLIKNPWSKSIVSEKLAKPVNGGALDTLPDDLIASLPSAHQPAGLFWITFDILVRNFESVFLNWSPALFPHVQDIHFNWKIDNELRYPDILEKNPQFMICTKGGEIWLLVGRHFKTGESNADSARLGARRNYIGLSLFDTSGTKVYLTSKAVVAQGDLISAPQTLLRIDLPVRTVRQTYTAVILQEALAPSTHSFSLHAFSKTPLDLGRAKDLYPEKSQHRSMWGPDSAGGDANSALYYTNPQFSLIVISPTPLLLFLESAMQDILLHLQLVLASGKRVQRLTVRNMLASSGSYRRGCAVAEAEMIEPGLYTIVCSTFSPGQQSDFTLTVGTRAPHKVEAIAAENAGLLTIPLNTTFAEGVTKIMCPLTPSRLSSISLRVRPLPSSRQTQSSSAIRASLVVGLNPLSCQVLSTTSVEGSFTDVPPSGLVLEKVNVSADMLSRGGLWLVLERAPSAMLASRQGPEDMDVRVLTEFRMQSGPWGEERT